MNTKHTFWTLCSQYDKIEVPIIQRDYAQGRETPEVIRLRKKFINDFLLNSILNNQKVELDFVYGSVLIEKKDDDKKRIFIPLDGQQRLTTLYLLHFFIALKEKRVHEILLILNKFNYETRPSAHDFCKKLINELKLNISYYDKFLISFKISNILKDNNYLNKISLLRILERKIEKRKFENKKRGFFNDLKKHFEEKSKKLIL